jgi:AAA ATPase domain
MKIQFKNFGPIEKAEIELKPLTIFVGINNTGKTWTAYALAGILGPYGYRSYADAYVEGNTPNTYQTLEEAIEQVIKHGAAAIDLVQFANDYGEIYFNDIARYVQGWMASFLSTELATFENLDVSIELAESKAKMIEGVLDTDIHSDIVGTEESPVLTIRKVSGDKQIVIYSSTQSPPSKDTNSEEIPSLIIRDFLVKTIFQTIHRTIYPFVQVLPTERTTFIAHPFRYRPLERGETQTQDRVAKEQKLRLAPGGVGHFLSMMKIISEVSEKRQRERVARDSKVIKEYLDLAQLLEEQILGGRLSYSQSDSESYLDKEVLFQLPTGSKIEISVASSMVKELSSLLFYLRYLAKPGELIIIDEPEMNLHPEAQVKLIEFLSILVNDGINVLITTHSPYLIDHLANLIRANDNENKELVKDAFYLKREDAFISKDKVSVYMFGQGQTLNVLDDEGVIDLDTFGGVSDRISEIYFAL